MSSENLMPDGTIIEALEEIAVKPTNRFYQRIDNQPWMQASHATPTHSTQKASWWGLRPVIVGLAVALFLGLLIWQVPPLRLLAQNLLSRFVQQPTDTIIQKELFPGSGEYVNWFEDQKQAIAKAEQAAGFKIALPAVLPEGYRFGQIIYIPDEKLVTSVYIYSTLSYTDAIARNVPDFSLLQQPLAQADKSPLSFKIGASAGVEKVSINGIPGEFVQGAWTSASSETSTVQWTQAACCRMLRWQTDEYVFTLFAWNYAGNPGFTDRDELVKIATNVTFAKK